MDLAVSIALLASTLAVGLVFALAHARQAYARVARDGGSVLLGARAMNAGYWALQPLGRACVRVGISANDVTLASLALSFVAGVLLATGHFGLAALVTALASLGDALDGLVARASGTASNAGEVLDAAVDRYAELFFLGGLAVHYRDSVAALVLVLAAILGSFMVSYSTAKAEALGVEPPRGAMRRAERATYLAIGAVLVPVAAAAFDALAPSASSAWPLAREAPMLAALALVAVVGNVSAVRRLRAVARAVSIGDGAHTHAGPRTRGLARTLATLTRHQIGAFAATALDFGTMAALVELGHVDPVRATLIGASCGAISNFLLGRRWVFRASDTAAIPQAARYALVAAASAALNTLGEHLVHDGVGVQYLLARVLVAVSVGALWNFPLHRWFVFRTESHRPAGP
jgi:CDP-diacylglycerol--glycerol-3-phosphate 3-phosphatidyltransferase